MTRVPSESGSGRREPCLVGLSRSGEAEGPRGTGRAVHRNVGRRSRPAAGRAAEGTCGSGQRLGPSLLAAAPRVGPKGVGPREKALPVELGCGMPSGGRTPTRNKVGACGWRAHTGTKEKLVECTLARLWVGKGCAWNEGSEQG
jgi:hypothetical protein